MKNKLYTCCIVILGSILLSSCSPKIDASSQEKLKTSVAAFKSELKEEQEIKFMAALEAIALNELKNSPSPQRSEEAILKALHGKTYQDIIDIAKELKGKK